MKSEIIVTSNWYTPQLIASNQTSLFVFGDNLLRVGKGGQAIIRDLPNTYGVATKAAPSMDESAFFNDLKDLHLKQLETDLGMLKEICNSGVYSQVVFPINGLGSGLSKLKEKAPKTHARMLELLKEYFGIEVTETSDGEILDTRHLCM